jgi:hypothetical protein
VTGATRGLRVHAAADYRHFLAITWQRYGFAREPAGGGDGWRCGDRAADRDPLEQAGARRRGGRAPERGASGLRTAGAPGRAAGRPRPFLRLRAGERARYLANFRYSGYNTDWYYEQWTINIARAPWRRDLFLPPGEFDHETDDRVSLYGGPR